MDGSLFEGLFWVFSPELEISLRQAHRIDPKNPEKIDPQQVEDKMVFPMNEVLRVSALDVDVDYAVKGELSTAICCFILSTGRKCLLKSHE